MEKLFPHPFLKNQIWVYLSIISLKFHTVYFIILQVEDYRNILKLSSRPHAFTSNKAFSKTKRSLGLVSLPHLSTWFLEKKISPVIIYYMIKFHCLVAFTSWDIEQYLYYNCIMCIAIVLQFTFKDQCSHHIETSHLICSSNQLTSFCKMGNIGH